MNIENVRNLLLPTQQGTFIRIGEIAEVGMFVGLTQIDRENRQREVTVYANAIGISPGVLMEQATLLVQEL